MPDYLQWRSKLSLEEVFAADESLAYPAFLNTASSTKNEYVFVSALNGDKTRSVLMLGDEAGGQCITPEPYSLRTKINEYGGKPYWLSDGELVFVNQNDQCLYRQTISRVTENDGGLVFGEPQRLSIKPTADQCFMYSDVQMLGNGHYMVIVEYFEAAQGAANNQCFIGLIDAANSNSAPIVLVSGADFYSNLVFNANGRVAWVQWNHPNMPWDQNQLWCARLNQQDMVYRIDDTQLLNWPSSRTGASHCQLVFDNADTLYFSVDFSDAEGADNYWNVYACDLSSGDLNATPVSQTNLEFGYPHWQYGDVRIIATAEGSLIAIGSGIDGDRLFSLNAAQSRCQEVYNQHSTIQHLASNGKGSVLAIEIAGDRRPELVRFDISGGVTEKTCLKAAKPYGYKVSRAKAVEFSTRDGATAHGFYYAPVNHSDACDDLSSVGGSNNDQQLPPLIVMVHGGPTARAYGHFDIQKQFWASNGFAILDVNHRGSSGYGRSFRDALYGKWGELDASDIVDGVKWLADNGLADRNRVCIRGKSAGGYAVLRALTEYPSIFKAGACYYGIGNLATLAEITHKFEKHYTDRLIDEPYNAPTAALPSSNYYSRSPINKIERIQSAMIIFQGGADKVVPPAVAHEVVDSLAANNIPHQYVEYPEEGHGFRQVENNIDAWTKELNFYRQALK